MPNQDSEIPPHLEAVLAVIELQLQRWVGVFRLLLLFADMDILKRLQQVVCLFILAKSRL